MNKQSFKESRRQQIATYIESNKEIKVDALSEMFGVSVATIRRDLNELARLGILNRVHGGAIKSEYIQLFGFAAFQLKEDLQREEKIAIGRYAAKVVKPRDTIYIGAGTTAFWVAKSLTSVAPITVVTNSLPLANLLAGIDSIELILVGGRLKRSEYTFVGEYGQLSVNNLHFNAVFLGMNGVHPEYGLTSSYPQELMTDRKFLSLGNNVIIVADHTKIGKVSAYKTGDITAATKIITTQAAPPDMVRGIRRKGVEVLLV